MTVTTLTQTLLQRYVDVRKYSEKLCSPLEAEDYVVQPTEEISPPKWHLGHTPWFFEQFFLRSFPDYKLYNPTFSFLFNSYYDGSGTRLAKTRGCLSRPTFHGQPNGLTGRLHRHTGWTRVINVQKLFSCASALAIHRRTPGSQITN